MLMRKIESLGISHIGLPYVLVVSVTLEGMCCTLWQKEESIAQIFLVSILEERRN